MQRPIATRCCSHPLLLAARERRRHAPHQEFEADPHDLGHFAGPLLGLGFRSLVNLEVVGQIPLAPHRRIERVVLEDHPYTAILRRHRGHIHSVEEDPAAVRGLQTRDDLQQRALAAPRCADQTDGLAIF
jgi:hypothetical protein